MRHREARRLGRAEALAAEIEAADGRALPALDVIGAARRAKAATRPGRSRPRGI